MSLRVISVPVSALPETAELPAELPADTVVIGVHCPHLDRPRFLSFVPPSFIREQPGLAALFGDHAPCGEPVPMPPRVMRHQAVIAWAAELPCGCGDAWWAQHGPSYVLLTEQDQTPCPHDGSVLTSYARFGRN